MVYFNKSTITITNIIKYSVCFLVPVVILIILYSSFYPFNQNFIGGYHDITANSLYHLIINENYFTTWNNMWAGGFPVVANPNSDKYYLFSVPFYLIFKDLFVINFILLFHILLAYFSFFKLGSLVTKNYNLLMIGSLLFAFSGMMFGRIYTGHHLLVYGLAWIPLVYYYFFKLTVFNEATIKNTVCLAIVSGMLYLTGDLYHFTYTFLILAIFFLYYVLSKQISRKTIYYILISVILISLVISIKFIPDFGVSGYLTRLDILNPLIGGGSLETDISSFVLGTGIENVTYSTMESTVMIGIIPVLLMVIGLIYGRKELTIPSYLAILFTVIWAAGGKTVLFALHYLPFLTNFRVPGRILGVIVPIVLFLALYGVVILVTKTKNGESLEITPELQNHILYGICGVMVIKLMEVPYQESISFITIIPAIIIGAFIALIYYNKGTFKNIILFLIGAIILNTLLIINLNLTAITENLTKLLFITLVLIALYIYIKVNSTNKSKTIPLCGILLFSILIMLMANIFYVTTFSTPFENSPAINVIQEIKKLPSENSQLWIFENGWVILHLDFTYWDIINDIHVIRIYQGQFLKTMPQLLYTIGNTTYSSADYIVDTQYLENGQQNLPVYTFKVKNISVYKPEHVLPNVFYVRNEQVYPLTIEKFGSDEVIAGGELLPGDVVILKGAYYPGWKANGVDTEPIVNMIGTRIKKDTNLIKFTFEPQDYKYGIILTIVGIVLTIAFIVKRKAVEGYIEKLTEVIVSKGNKKKQRL